MDWCAIKAKHEPDCWISSRNVGRRVRIFDDPFCETCPCPMKVTLVEFLNYYAPEPNAPYRCQQFQFWIVNYGTEEHSALAIRVIGIAEGDPQYMFARPRPERVVHCD